LLKGAGANALLNEAEEIVAFLVNALLAPLAANMVVPRFWFACVSGFSNFLVVEEIYELVEWFL
jgi:hypothetical protein